MLVNSPIVMHRAKILFIVLALVFLSNQSQANKKDNDSVNIKFALNTLNIKLRTEYATKLGDISIVDTSFSKSLYNLSFNTTYDTTIYAAEAPNGIEPSDSLGRTFVRYKENNISAGIMYDGKYKLILTGFPFETILNNKKRDLFMKNVLDYLNR